MAPGLGFTSFHKFSYLSKLVKIIKIVVFIRQKNVYYVRLEGKVSRLF